jgi:cell division septation protein DedD
MRGPDQILLRLPLGGGRVRAFSYPALDSVLWSSRDVAPSLERVLGFDEEAGSVAAVDRRGVPVRLDLHLGRITRDAGPRLTGLRSRDGSSIYGINKDGGVVRLTPSGSWTFKPPSPAREVLPATDGSLLVLADRDDRTVVWQLFPPERTVTDSAVVPRAKLAVRTQVGDRVYFGVGAELLGLRTRGLDPVPAIRLEHPARTLAPTPSGDRLYVVTDPGGRIAVADRYSGKVEQSIELPGTAIELRMDPTGRYLLARSASGDSAWVIAVGTGRLVGTVASAWRADLPAVTPDGWIATVRARDVVLVDGETLRPQGTVKGGASDAWLFVAWDGFRQRTPALDEPVVATSDSGSRSEPAGEEHPIPAAPPRPDSAGAPRTAPAPQPPSAPRAGAPPHADSAQAPSTGVGFTVQFAAVLSEQSARATAQEIMVNGQRPRVVATQRSGTTIYRVVMGPYATRAEAERMATAAGKPFWIYEGAP